MNFFKIVTIASVFVFQSLAMAGLTQPAPVTIDLEALVATGDMVTARRSDNEFEFIGCGTRNSDTGTGDIFSFAFCQASVAEDSTVICTTINPELVAKVSDINDSSFVSFRWNEDGECVSLGFSTQSLYMFMAKKDLK